MRAIFLDRDGVINENRDDHVKSWDEFALIPGAMQGMRLLSEAGWPIFVVTNQAAVNRGLVSHQTLEQINGRMVSLAHRHGARIRDVRYCPHRPDERCRCRKPSPGMLTSLAAEHGVDLARSYLVGDALTDVAAGHAVGCTTVLVQTGRGQQHIDLPEVQRWRPDHLARDLYAAAQWILAEERRTVAAPQPHCLFPVVLPDSGF